MVLAAPLDAVRVRQRVSAQHRSKAREAYEEGRDLRYRAGLLEQIAVAQRSAAVVDRTTRAIYHEWQQAHRPDPTLTAP